jgi:uncharacterized Zn finger protein (UPF0148 family)
MSKYEELDENISLQCPLCGFPIIVARSWAIKNGRIFCDTCCKAFDVEIKQEERDSIPYRKTSKEKAEFLKKFDEEEAEQKSKEESKKPEPDSEVEDDYDYGDRHRGYDEW